MAALARLSGIPGQQDFNGTDATLSATELLTSMTVATENATSQTSPTSRNSHFSVQIEIESKSQFEFVPPES